MHLSSEWKLRNNSTVYFLHAGCVCNPDEERTWIVTTALGSAMTYSSTAAVHAVVLVTLRTKLASSHYLMEGIVVLVNGTSETGLDDGSGDSALWLPVLPMAWDNDADLVLAVVGTSFLALLPMQLWSKTFKKSEAKTELSLWSGLLLTGTLSALINSVYVDLWSFPRSRYCPPDANDAFPLRNSGTTPFDVSSELAKVCYWNMTVYGTLGKSQNQLPNASIYPCFTSSWPLRDPTEIALFSESYGQKTDTSKVWCIVLAVYALVGSSCLSSLTMLVPDLAAKPPEQLVAVVHPLRNPISYGLAVLRKVCFEIIGKPIYSKWCLCLGGYLGACRSKYSKIDFVVLRIVLREHKQYSLRLKSLYFEAI